MNFFIPCPNDITNLNKKFSIKLKHFTLIFMSISIATVLQRNSYNSYRSKSDGIYEFPELNRPAHNKDRYYMSKDIIPILIYLNQNNVIQKDFCELLKKKYRLRAQDLFKLIDGFQDYINNISQNDIIFIRSRQLRKSNFMEKNIVLNKIAFDYSSDFLHFVENNYIKNIKLSDKRKACLIEDLKKIVNSVSNREKRNAFSFLSFDQELDFDDFPINVFEFEDDNNIELNIFN